MSDTHHEDVQSHVKTYIKVFVALAVGTVVTVLASNVHLGIILGIIVALVIATVKGSLVAAFFMHLSAERKMIYWVLVLTATFVVVMVGLFAVSYRPTRVASHAPPTTLGESSRPSVPVPVAPNQQP